MYGEWRNFFDVGKLGGDKQPLLNVLLCCALVACAKLPIMEVILRIRQSVPSLECVTCRDSCRNNRWNTWNTAGILALPVLWVAKYVSVLR